MNEKDKRKNNRFSCCVPVNGKRDDISTPFQTIDFSKGGVGLLSSEDIPVEQKIAMELILKKDDTPIFVIGKVKWNKELDNFNKFRLGLSFEDVSESSKKELEKYFKERVACLV